MTTNPRNIEACAGSLAIEKALLLRELDAYQGTKRAQLAADVLSNHAASCLAELNARGVPRPTYRALINASRALLARLETISSEDFAKGGEKEEREALKRALRPFA